MKILKNTTFAFLILSVFLFSLTVYADDSGGSSFYGIMTKESTDLIKGDSNSTQIEFENGDIFNITKLSPYFDDASLKNEIFIPGENIKISFFDSMDNFVTQNTYENLPQKTLYIETTVCSGVISIGAVYNSDSEYNTIVPVSDKESPLTAKITQTPEKGYIFTGDFTLNTDEFAEMWYLLSTDTENERVFLAKDDDFTMASLKINKFSENDIRLCSDGYYFEAPAGYLPMRKNMLYRQPACYTGVSFARYGKCRLFDELGYAMLKLSAQSQNDEGYWETTPYVDWLKADFNIGKSFYDTRFNTDFALGLAVTYSKYKDTELLEYLFKYTDYFFKHTEDNHIDVGDGWLIRDYAPKESSSSVKKTHSSLNHHLAEIVFLNELYGCIIGFDINEYEMFKDYSFVQNPELITQLSQKMLKGVENTSDYWIMEDGNLQYAYGYTGTANVMRDYPYLTYNDLFTLNKQIKKATGNPNPVLEKLMASKKMWMDKNEITGYLTQ